MIPELQMIPNASKWFHTAPDGSRWLQMAPDRSRWFLMPADGSRWDQMDPEGFEWVQMCGILIAPWCKKAERLFCGRHSRQRNNSGKLLSAGMETMLKTPTRDAWQKAGPWGPVLACAFQSCWFVQRYLDYTRHRCVLDSVFRNRAILTTSRWRVSRSR